MPPTVLDRSIHPHLRYAFWTYVQYASSSSSASRFRVKDGMGHWSDDVATSTTTRRSASAQSWFPLCCAGSLEASLRDGPGTRCSHSRPCPHRIREPVGIFWWRGSVGHRHRTCALGWGSRTDRKASSTRVCARTGFPSFLCNVYNARRRETERCPHQRESTFKLSFFFLEGGGWLEGSLSARLLDSDSLVNFVCHVYSAPRSWLCFTESVSFSRIPILRIAVARAAGCRWMYTWNVPGKSICPIE